MIMAEATRDQVERATVYLTPQNKKRLAQLRRGEKTRKLNDALDRAFAMEEREQAFETFMDHLNKIEPMKPLQSSAETLRLLREGRDHEVADRKPTTL